MGNLELWEKLHRPPVTALKTIKGGRMSGKTDISPQWRLKIMTEIFGPVGIGWKYTIDKLWTEPGSDDQVCAFANVSIYVKHEGEWSAAIQGNGGSMLIANEKSGPYTSDEAYKMATTDALGVAMKALGVAAEIYLGNFDGSKYKTPPEEAPKVDVSAAFKAATKDLDQEQLKTFVTETATANDKTENEIKETALKYLDRFKTAFEKWKPKESALEKIKRLEDVDPDKIIEILDRLEIVEVETEEDAEKVLKEYEAA